MTKFVRLLAASLFLLVSGCAGMEVADFRPYVTLPASERCFGVTVLTKQEHELPREECEALKKRAVFLDSENYKMLRTSIQRNCQHFKCRQIIGAFDQLFIVIDDALERIPQD